MSPGERPGVVFDCMLFLQATASRVGPAAELLRHLDAGRFTLYVSEAILVAMSRPAWPGPGRRSPWPGEP